MIESKNNTKFQIFLISFFLLFIILIPQNTSSPKLLNTAICILLQLYLFSYCYYFKIHKYFYFIFISFNIYFHYYIQNLTLLNKATFLFLLIFYFLISENYSILEKKFINLKLIKIFTFSNWMNLVLIFLFTSLTQNQYLHYELIDWDVSAYLVSSLDISRGSLPYEIQWESKQPLFYYIYYLFIYISGKNYIYFRILNDLFVYIFAILIYFISLGKNSKGKNHSLFFSLFYLAILSNTWATVESSEIYSLLFLSMSYFIFDKISKNKYLIIHGTLFSFSIFINIGTAIFVLPYFVQILKISDFNFLKITKKLLFFAIPSIILEFILLIFYSSKGLIDELIYSQFIIPFEYTQTEFSPFRGFLVFLENIFEYNIFLLFTLMFSFAILLFNLNKDMILKFNKIMNLDFFLVSSVLFYVLASKGYFHHLHFFIFFLICFLAKTNLYGVTNIFSVLILITFLSISTMTFQKSFQNLNNIEKIYQNYPIYQISQLIYKNYEVEKLNVLALDHTLLLFYLDVPNYSYIVHPSNNSEEFVVKNLLKLKRINKDYINYLLETEPDILICSNNTFCNPEIADYKPDKYQKINTEKYLENSYFDYYDYGREIRLYVRKK